MRVILIISTLLSTQIQYAQDIADKTTIYLIPGMGTDCRVFKHFTFDSTLYNSKCIQWVEYSHTNSLNEYSTELSRQIDTTTAFVLVGVSMGGMIAMEMQNYLSPLAIILISSAKCKQEIPSYFRLSKYLPIYNLLNKNLMNRVSNNDMIYNEIDLREDQGLYKSMLLDTGHEFLKWQINSIINWDNECENNKTNIFHIHGNSDNVLLLRNIKANVVIENGTHKMVINKSSELSRLISDYISELLAIYGF